MNTQSRKGISFVLCVLALVLSLACAVPGASGGAGQATAPSSDLGGSTGGVDTSDACDSPTDQFVDVTGTYSVRGGKADQTGEKYTGVVTIANVGQNCFSIGWKYDGGRTRTGKLQMIGNIMSGSWQEGDQTGTFGATASADSPFSIWWGNTGGDSTEYLELLTKQ